MTRARERTDSEGGSGYLWYISRCVGREGVAISGI